MPDTLGIWNDAMGLLGLQPLPDLNGTSDAARTMRDLWTRVPAAILEEADWNSAMTRVQLARLEAAPAHGYRYYYQKPAGVARIVYLNDTGEEDKAFERWRDEGDRIATDVETVYLWYIAKDAEVNPGGWQQVLADYCAAEMAIRCVSRLAPKRENFVAKVLDDRRRKAKAIDAKNNPPGRKPMGRWARARLGGLRNGEQG